MKADIRKGKRTGSPVSVPLHLAQIRASHAIRCIQTRVQRAVNRLLRRPHLWCHLRDLSLLIFDNETLRMLEARGRCEERAVTRRSVLSCYAVCHPAGSKRKAILTHVESLPVFLSFAGLCCACAKLMMSHLGSERFAACRTRPQYVLRSYWDAGRSLLPGREADMAGMEVARAKVICQRPILLSQWLTAACMKVEACDKGGSEIR
jgi:hypothetical protein